MPQIFPASLLTSQMLFSCECFPAVALALPAILHSNISEERLLRIPRFDASHTTVSYVANLTQSSRANRPPLGRAVGIGLAATTAVALGAIVGVVFAPLHKYKYFPVLISFMMAAAVGSLVSSALLVLIPEALGLDNFDRTNSSGGEHWYVPITVSICVGSFFFYILEFVLTRVRVILERQNPSIVNLCSHHSPVARRLAMSGSIRINRTELGIFSENGGEHINGKIHHADGVNGVGDCARYVEIKNGSVASVHNDSNAYSIKTSPSSARNGRNSPFGDLTPTITFRTPQLCSKLGKMDPVVWMIIIGDALHNFMDGLSLGTSFTSSISLGISLTLAILCEEIPHELGDLAVLLRAGLSIPLAIFFNFVSACTAYIGFVVGVFVGELSEASTYIFAITAGFFLYIALADMLAELRKTEEMVEDNDRQLLVLFVAHCTGMIFGFGCILTITMTSGYISL